jgi:hypothetical protein
VSCVLDEEILCISNEENPENDIPPFFNPANHLSAQPKCVSSTQDSPLSAFKHIPLVDQIIQNLPPLGQKLIQSTVSVLDEAMFI